MQAARHAVALEDLRRVDAPLAESRKRIIAAVAASGTSVTDITGVGPIVAAIAIGYSCDIRRFAVSRALVRCGVSQPEPSIWSPGCIGNVARWYRA